MNWQFPVHITGTRAEISMLLKQGKNVTKTEESCTIENKQIQGRVFKDRVR